MIARRDLTGQTFGKLTVLRSGGANRHRQSLWVCQCECGALKRVAAYNLIAGRSKSCGCATRWKANGKQS